MDDESNSMLLLVGVNFCYVFQFERMKMEEESDKEGLLLLVRTLEARLDETLAELASVKQERDVALEKLHELQLNKEVDKSSYARFSDVQNVENEEKESKGSPSAKKQRKSGDQRLRELEHQLKKEERRRWKEYRRRERYNKKVRRSKKTDPHDVFPINELPVELFWKVLSTLTWAEWGRCSLVCKYWQTVIADKTTCIQPHDLEDLESFLGEHSDDDEEETELIDEDENDDLVHLLEYKNKLG